MGIIHRFVQNETRPTLCTAPASSTVVYLRELRTRQILRRSDITIAEGSSRRKATVPCGHHGIPEWFGFKRGDSPVRSLKSCGLWAICGRGAKADRFYLLTFFAPSFPTDGRKIGLLICIPLFQRPRRCQTHTGRAHLNKDKVICVRRHFFGPLTTTRPVGTFAFQDAPFESPDRRPFYGALIPFIPGGARALTHGLSSSAEVCRCLPKVSYSDNTCLGAEESTSWLIFWLLSLPTSCRKLKPQSPSTTGMCSLCSTRRKLLARSAPDCGLSHHSYNRTITRSDLVMAPNRSGGRGKVARNCRYRLGMTLSDENAALSAILFALSQGT
ncbi:Biphenyl dioxygenase subunit beta (Biphenyl 2,3-dioxygenase) [Anopheles sinensis]|uniref:Biphenyl dioxygenase subunit beta (Biphenyl 2,3-dioxygenase) n=1 Tax=Anopheles sinensis TaxID=74873 RepID=A0A084WBQ3_ANOSI|nr:Biphenyl dioxygenase subunit beta (Biphenyl 2,3-dioxygenase) [Anopheles sinensis]